MHQRPRELMTGQEHPHWLTLLGLGPLQPLRAWLGARPSRLAASGSYLVGQD
ncbi:MAG: hypothetical protein JF606_28460 [Burkholderiales bacterium]|nr:hypothetical protein [Burkholderiales bacterium]